MIPTYTPDVVGWNEAYQVVSELFTTLGIPLFRDTYFQYFALLLLLIGIALFLWRWFRGA